MGTKFCADTAQMGLDGCFRDKQFFRDATIPTAFGQMEHHLVFTLGELFDRRAAGTIRRIVVLSRAELGA